MTLNVASEPTSSLFRRIAECKVSSGHGQAWRGHVPWLGLDWPGQASANYAKGFGSELTRELGAWAPACNNPVVALTRTILKTARYVSCTTDLFRRILSYTNWD